MGTKLRYTLVLCVVVGLASLLMNYVVYVAVPLFEDGWVLTLLTTEALALPLVYFLVSQRFDMRTARDALLLSQARQAELLQDLKAALGAAEAANEAKSSFLAMMSHEIRTPLNGVLGMAQAMSQNELDASQHERLAVIRQSGEALLAILNDILDLSKIEAGRVELESIPFDLEEVLRGAYAAFTQLANRKGVSFALDLGDAAGVYRGDPTRVRQILYNLISNALKFTDEGEVRVSAQHLDGQLLLQVRDTGIGMPEDVLTRLFTKFSQANASTTRQYGGTGLGLAISRQLAELMGGSIEVDSRVGEGSTFIVKLPTDRQGAAGSLHAAPLVQEESLPQDGGPIRLLAAEDNAVNQLVLKALLHQFTDEICMVSNGQEAVDRWTQGEFDIVLMDVQMPILDGPSACREIRRLEMEQGRPRTPIIALTANAMSHQVEAYAEAGMDGHVAKPIDAGELLATMARVLKAHREPLS